MSKITKIKNLIDLCNKYRDAYYNHQPLVSDDVYDRYFDELTLLEKETGCYFANSPTQSVGYTVVDTLPKVRHNIPLLSLAKTKLIDDVVKFAGDKDVLFMIKGDGLTTKLVYKSYDGITAELVEASTRGDGIEGSLITHNAKTFNIPLKVNYGKSFTVVGESIILKDELERINASLPDEDKYSNCRNLASGSLSLLDSEECAKRHIHFMAFDVIEGMDNVNSLYERFNILTSLGFEVIFHQKTNGMVAEETSDIISNIHKYADDNGIPCDGVVIRYDDYSYGMSLGKTSHHYNYGLAKKEDDDFVETIFRDIEWNTTRTGLISPTAIFDPVNILDSIVSRATLHNINYIENLKLRKNNRICCSKRNMVIPAVEVNLDYSAEDYKLELPKICNVCGHILELRTSDTGTKNLYCNNPNCQAQLVGKLTHFVSKHAMNIQGVSESIIETLVDNGYVECYSDIYNLEEYKDVLIAIDGFGQKSYENLINSINKSRNTTLERFIVAMGIPNIGRSAAKTIARHFKGDLSAFVRETVSGFDYTTLEDFGQVAHDSVYKWLMNFSKKDLVALSQCLNFNTNEYQEQNIADNPFNGKNIAVTGKLTQFTRDSINAKLESLGAKPVSGVTSKTDYLINNDATSQSSKNKKANGLHIPIITESEFLDMIGE